MRKVFFLPLLLVAIFTSGKAFALGECGLSCCLAGSVAGGLGGAERFGLSVSYEQSYMETIKTGTDEVSPDEAIERNQQPMKSYKVPLEMRMQKVTLTGLVPVTERLKLMAFVPYVVNDMDMRTRSAMGMDMDMRMEAVSGLGDVSLLALYTLYTDAPVRPEERLTVGVGVKTPTGETGEKTSSGTLVHAMMQPGTGSWDPLFVVNYMRAFYPLVLQGTLFYQLTTEGYNGYEFGDQATLDLTALYQAASYINLGLELHGVHAEKDDDHDGRYTRADTSMVDNPANTGLNSLFISPVVQVKFPGTGGSGELKYQVPLYQDVEGFQQVVDWRVIGSLSWAF